MGSPGVVEGKQTMKILLTGHSWLWPLLPPRPPLRLLPLLRPMLIPGMDTMDMEDTEAIMATPDLMDIMVTMERGLLRLSLLLRPMPLLGPMLIRGMDTTDTEDTEVIMAMPDLMDTTVTMERGLLRLCLLLRPRLPPRLRLIPGMDTMD